MVDRRHVPARLLAGCAITASVTLWALPAAHGQDFDADDAYDQAFPPDPGGPVEDRPIGGPAVQGDAAGDPAIGGPPVMGGSVGDPAIAGPAVGGGPVVDPALVSPPLGGGPVEDAPIEGEPLY